MRTDEQVPVRELEHLMPIKDDILNLQSFFAKQGGLGNYDHRVLNFLYDFLSSIDQDIILRLSSKVLELEVQNAKLEPFKEQLEETLKGE